MKCKEVKLRSVRGGRQSEPDEQMKRKPRAKGPGCKIKGQDSDWLG